MPRVGRHRDGVDRAMLGAEGAAGAVGGDLILDERGALARRAAALQVGLVFVAEVAQGREHRVGGRFAQAAEAAGADLAGQLFEFVQVRALRLARAKLVQNIQHPLGADAAEGAFAARLVLRELEEIARDIHHAGGVIQHHHPARTHDRADVAQRFVIHRRVRQAAGTQPPDGPPICTALIRRPSADAAADFFDDLRGALCPSALRSVRPGGFFRPARTPWCLCSWPCRGRRSFSAPWRMIHGTSASVSTLLISVGLPHRPDWAGKGGRSRGIPRRPSTEAISAVSSPQTNAPAPSLMLRCATENRLPSKAAPSQPRCSHSASAARTRRTASGYSWRM